MCVPKLRRFSVFLVMSICLALAQEITVLSTMYTSDQILRLRTRDWHLTQWRDLCRCRDSPNCRARRSPLFDNMFDNMVSCAELIS
jgi:hypothetical protein